ncbi:MAG: hypothetical protein QM722_04135 [Piscinibacter sp.]
MRQDVVAIGRSIPGQGWHAGRPPAGITWRHVATALLLMIVAPVALVAGVAALAVAPIVIAVVGIQQVQQLARAQRHPGPARERH